MHTVLTIEQDSRPGRKSRRFSAQLLGYLTADMLWPGGGTDTKAVRPVWAQIASSHDAAGPFLMNLKMGKKASSGRDKSDAPFEWLKSAGYAYAMQKTDAGVLATVYLPDLFRADPGMVDPAGVRFVVLPTAAWIAAQAQAIDVEACVEHMMRLTEPGDYMIKPQGWNAPVGKAEFERQAALLGQLAPLATLFALYLDRRTRCPILPDVAFQLQVLVRCLRERRACLPSEPRSYRSRDDFAQDPAVLAAVLPDDLGYAPPIACSASHDDIEQILAEETELFLTSQAKGRKRAPARQRTSRETLDAA